MKATAKGVKTTKASRATSSTRSAAPLPAHELFSTRSFSSDAGKLSVEALAGSLADARKVFLASAYYDGPFCSALLAKVPKAATSVRLVFNGLGGTRLLAQRDQLADLERTLKKRAPASEIRLAFAPGIFHTKLLMAEGPSGAVAYVGSANATMAAMRVNEEILLRVSGSAALNDYADRIWSGATALSKVNELAKPKNLIAFFRTGALYFKPTTSLQITLNPFTPLLAALPDSEKKKLGTAVLPYADQETGIGPFNLRRALELGDGTSDSKVSVKPYSIETCLGYWVPQALEGQWQKSFGGAAAAKRARWTGMLAALESAPGKALARRYTQYTGAVKDLLASSNVDIAGHLPNGTRSPFDIELFQSFLARVLARLKNDEYLDRLCSPFVRCAMPEIWDDPLAYHDFEVSFFEYLEFIAQNPGNRPRAPGRILKVIDAATDVPAADAKKLLKAHLESNGWDPAKW